jgi:hypothetical protein
MTKTMSPEAIEANRRNAQQSTGPKSREGKAVVRMNAVKDGILADQVVIWGHKIQESPAEFKNFCNEYYDHLAPVGPLEEMLVDQIVAFNWRLRRARMAESAEIALSVHHAWRCNKPDDPELTWSSWLVHRDPIFSMQKTAVGNGLIKNGLSELRDAVERDGELTEQAIDHLVRGFCGRKNVLTMELEELRLETSKNPESLALAALREANKKRVLDCLDRKLQKLQERILACRDDEERYHDSLEQAAILPSTETVDKILRYETALERQLFRAMTELERLQRRRLGEKIPPPLTMEVSAS